MTAGEFEQEFVVGTEHGLHARPAGMFVTLAMGYKSKILVSSGGEWVNGDSVLSLLSLAASPGTTLRIRAVGADAEDAVQRLGRLIEEGAA
jgi:phosphocarrier protein HPr